MSESDNPRSSGRGVSLVPVSLRAKEEEQERDRRTRSDKGGKKHRYERDESSSWHFTDEDRETAQAILIQVISEGGTYYNVRDLTFPSSEGGDRSFPRWCTYSEWMRKYPEFREDYLQAKETSSDLIEMQLLEDAINLRRIALSGNAAFTGAHARAFETSLRQRQWVLEKRRPKQIEQEAPEFVLKGGMEEPGQGDG